MKKILLGTAVALVLLTGCNEEKKAPATQTEVTAPAAQTTEATAPAQEETAPAQTETTAPAQEETAPAAQTESK